MMDDKNTSCHDEGGDRSFFPQNEKSRSEAPAFIILFRGLALPAPIPRDHAVPSGWAFVPEGQFTVGVVAGAEVPLP